MLADRLHGQVISPSDRLGRRDPVCLNGWWHWGHFTSMWRSERRRGSTSKAWQASHLLRLDQPFKLLKELTRKMPIAEQNSGLDVPLLTPLGEVR